MQNHDSNTYTEAVRTELPPAVTLSDQCLRIRGLVYRKCKNNFVKKNAAFVSPYLYFFFFFL
jgi:hypothetical protein